VLLPAEESVGMQVTVTRALEKGARVAVVVES